MEIVNRENYGGAYLSFLQYAQEHPDFLLEEYRKLIESSNVILPIYHKFFTEDGGVKTMYYIDMDGRPCQWGPKAHTVVLEA
jgi:hypothetical protein